MRNQSASLGLRIILWFLLLALPARLVADGVVTSCDEAGLRAALAGGGVVTFACDGTITITNTLAINTNTIIDGTGRNVTISGGNAVRVFMSAAGVELTLIHLTIADGSIAGFGGAVGNSGWLRATSCTFKGNHARGGSGLGGAIANFNGSRLSLDRCSFLGNTAGHYGGAIGDYTLVGPHVITNCTFAFNAAPRGAAIGTACASDVTDYFVNVTFWGHSGPAIENMSTKAPVLINSLVAGSTGLNCVGAILDGGYNLSSDSSCNLTNSGSLMNVDPQLAPLGNYGGPTETLALINGSLAVDAANTAAAPATDQRGEARPAGAAADIGAFEGSVPVKGLVSLEHGEYLCTEADATVTLAIVRGGDLSETGTIDLATIPGSALSEVDYAGSTVTVTFEPGQTRKDIAVSLINDTIREVPETFSVVLSNPTGGLWLKGKTNATVTINDDDVTLVSDCTDAGVRQALAVGGTIRFACDGTITLASNLVATVTAALDAAGRSVTLSGDNATRVFTVLSGVHLSLHGLQIANGMHATEGGGILNNGMLTLRGCTLSNNFVTGMSGFRRGGAVLNLGSAELVDCTFVTNRATGGTAQGGAVFNAGALAVRQCTFVGNIGPGGGALANGPVAVRAGLTNSTFWHNSGPAIHDYASQGQEPLWIVNCTFAENVGAPLGAFAGGRLQVANSIVGFMQGSFQDQGNNLVWSAPANAIDLRLGPLADHGGPTWTVSLLPSSPAIDQGKGTYCPPTDQRGVARPYGPACDIGAYETTVAPDVTLFQFSAAAYNTNENAGSARITVIRAGNSGGPGTVRYTMSPGTASTFHDFTAGAGELNFANGQTSLTFTVSIKDDFVPESNETINLSLSQRPGNPGIGNPSSATLTINDNDPIQPGALAFAQPAYSVSEDAAFATLWVTRAGGTNGSVSVDYGTSDGTAIGGIDYSPTSGTLTFADGEVAKSMIVALIRDAPTEPSKTLNITLSNPGGGASLGSPASTTLTIVDQRHLVNCDEAALRAAVSAGGTIVLACNGTIVLTSPLIVSNGCHIDAANYNPTLSGRNATRLFIVNPGVRLHLTHVALADGLALGTNGITGDGSGPQAGGIGVGGAIYNVGGTLLAEGCSFLRNQARGGTGAPGSGFPGAVGPGGMARGGAIHSQGGQVTLMNCSVRGNEARGGTAGTGPSGNVGGESAGGAISIADSYVELLGCLVAGNVSVAGRGTRINGSLGGSGLATGGAFELESGRLILSHTVVAQNNSWSEFNFHAMGGAIIHRGGALLLSNSLVTGNLAQGGQGLLIGSPWGLPGGNGYGGGLHVLGGCVELVNSTIASNRAVGGSQLGGAQAGSGQGGGIYNSRATITIANFTLAHNGALAGATRAIEGAGIGGGIYNLIGVLALRHATIAENAARNSPGTVFAGVEGIESGGGIYSGPNGLVTLYNTIVANNPAGMNGFGPLVDGGGNLSSDGSCNFTAPGSLNNTDPMLGPLADYGGPAPTMALLAGSPAVDTANSASCLPTDQRSRVRPAGAACDIGAFESSVPYTMLGKLNGYIPPAGTARVESGSLTAPVSAHGSYALHGLNPGAYTIKPESAFAVFMPKTTNVNVVADTVSIDFSSYRTNGLVIQWTGPGAVSALFAGEAGVAYDVQLSTGLPPSWNPYDTLTADGDGFIRWAETNSIAGPGRFFRVRRP